MRLKFKCNWTIPCFIWQPCLDGFPETRMAGPCPPEILLQWDWMGA